MLERALRSLLPVKPGKEMALTVLDAVRESTGGPWAALYRLEGERYDLLASSADDGARPPQSVPLERTRARPARDLHLAAPLELGAGEHFLLLAGRGAGPLRHARPVVEQVVEACRVALGNSVQYDRLSSLVFLDALTGCYNRRGFDEHLKVEMVRARRYRRPLTLLLLDIDNFKEINDGFGHPVGDVALRRVGEALRSAFRTTDFSCRFGGDEFAVIFPETPRDEVVRLAERLRLAIQALFPDPAIPRELTASLGLAGYPVDARDAGELVEAADRALYRAKAEGRNRVAGV